jgi:hypothetical protein
MTKFKFGDLIVGNLKANEHYTYTRKDTYWVVIDAEATNSYSPRANIYVVEHEGFNKYKERFIKDPKNTDHVESWSVNDEYFDFVRNLVLTANKHNAHVLEKLDI